MTQDMRQYQDVFEKGLNISEVETVTDHKTASQLFRYVQVNASL